MRRIMLLALPFLGLSACATMSVEQRVEAKLVDAGLNPPMARCMAHRLVKKLSVAQLRELGRLAALSHRPGGQLSVDELAYRLRAIDDPEIVSVVVGSGLECAIAA